MELGFQILKTVLSEPQTTIACEFCADIVDGTWIRKVERLVRVIASPSDHRDVMVGVGPDEWLR